METKQQALRHYDSSIQWGVVGRPHGEQALSVLVGALATAQKSGGHLSGLFFQHITEKDAQVEKVTGPESLKFEDAD